MVTSVSGQRRAIATIGRRSVLAASVALLAGCGGSKSEELRAPDYVDHSVKTLAITPTDTLFSNDSSRLSVLVGIEMGRRGYKIIDAEDVKDLFSKNNVSLGKIVAPAGLAVLTQAGADAVVTVNATTSAIGGPPMRHVQVQVTNAHTGNRIGEVLWHNAWGGMPGSPADYTMRKGADAAAREIADALVKLLG